MDRAESTSQSKFKPASSPLSPTEYLTNALRNAGYKLDNVELQDSGIGSSNNSRRKPIPPSKVWKQRPIRRCLQTILADYIQFVGPLLARAGEVGVGSHTPSESELDNALAKVLDAENLRYLEARCYDVTDVVAWTWILESKSTHDAILRMLALEEEHGAKHGSIQRVPPFIPLYLLRTQKRLSAKAFQLLLTYSLRLIIDQGQPSESANTPIDPNMRISFVESLLHRAREVWPQAQLDIARAFSSYLTSPENEVATSQKHRFRAEKANEILGLLSLPSSGSPFTSASTQQEAQFEILKAMAGQQPVLPVTRKGYRGIIAVQLAHKKTQAERQSAELKAPSWPPWKEERLGIDSHRGNEGMKSRAMQVIGQMTHAGYSHSSWEAVAAILAGWDTDQSPTIQTRGRMHRTSRSSEPLGGESDYIAIWVARIRATRTLREAWACFLSYQDLGLPPHRRIYAAVAEKMIFREKAVRQGFEQVSLALPGDAPEVFPEPFSARDVIYVHTKPPTLDEFLKQMLSQGVRPSGRFLSLLLRSAPTFEVGLEYICCSELSNCQINALCTVRGAHSECHIRDQKVLDEIPDHVFSAFIGFLCKFSRLDRHLARSDIRMMDLFPVIMDQWDMTETTTLFAFRGRRSTSMIHCSKILSHAIQLVRLRGSRSPQPWIHLLAGLNKYRISVRYRMVSPDVQLVLAWHELVEVVGWMNERAIEHGLQGFRILCKGFIKAVTVAVNNPIAAEKAMEVMGMAECRKHIKHLDHVSRTPEDLVQNGLRILKNQFDKLVLLDPKISHLAKCASDGKDSSESRVTVPPMPCVPTPAVLHAFVRALGVAEDYDGLMSLLRWMGQTAPALKECSDELLGGPRMMRRTVVAIRVFLERPWGKTHIGAPSLESNGDGEPVFTDPNLQEAYEIIEATPLLGPWPNEEEVWEYVNEQR